MSKFNVVREKPKAAPPIRAIDFLASGNGVYCSVEVVDSELVSFFLEDAELSKEDLDELIGLLKEISAQMGGE